ncbi:MAG: tetratricopeptide repeat protein [Armatimonadetes bacterium]|nr:tetratricopeptide repeat protein [Armatimonadota bacterium]
MRWFQVFLSLALSVRLLSPTSAAPASLTEAEDLLSQKDFPRAEEALKPLVEGGGEAEDYARFLLGEALFEQGKYPEAHTAYGSVVTKFPDSAWKQKALYRSADCLARLKQFEKAGDALQPAMEALVSEGRKEQVAAAYLKYADQYLDPKNKDEKPNYPKARALYQKALELGITKKTAARVQLSIARCDFESSNFPSSIQVLERLLKDIPDGEQAAEARYLLGRSYLGLDNGPRARRVFRDFLEDYPNNDLRPKVSFAIALTYHVPSPRTDREMDLGVKALRDYSEKYPKTDDSLKADYWIPLSYYSRNRFEEASKEIARFLKQHEGSGPEYLAPAQQMLGEIAFRQKRYSTAIESWREFLKQYPNHSLWPGVQRRVLDTEYLIGQDAFEKKKYEEAAGIWRKFQEQYPLDQRNPDLMFMLGQMEYDQKNYEAALEKWQQLTSKYEGTEAAARGWLMTGAIQEEKLGDFDKAAESYQKVKVAQWANEAAQRLQAMKEKKLVVYTEKTFTTVDKPVLKLLTRNLDKLEFRAYRINLEDYFRKINSIRGVEGLDLALIDPDQKWEFPVPDYKEKKQMESQAPLPFSEPGVYAVVCSAHTGTGTEALEATTVVMITDLQIITKATRRDMLVFAENLKEQKPWPEAQVLLSDGTKVVAVGKADGNGIFQLEVEGLKDMRQLQVLAFSGTHYASTENPLQGLRYVAGLAPKALIYPDRPLYRPGQEVHLRGIVRRVEKGEYVFTAGETLDLQVLSPAGAAIFKRQVRLEEFGAFAESLTLPQEATPGTYRVVVTQDKLTFTGGFEVGEYQLPKIRMEITLPRTTYLRGEKAEGKVSVKYYYGEPVVNRKVAFTWGDEPEKEMTTNDKGEFEFSLDTRRFEEEAVFLLQATLKEEEIFAAVNVHVAPVELSASLSTLRDVYLLGEKFEVYAQAKDLSGKPAEAKFTLHVLKREKNEEAWGEREVEKKELTTDSKEGKSAATISLDQSGTYVLRLQGVDRHDNPVSAERSVTIVGEDDKVKLRLLTDTDTFKVGDTAALRIVSRADRNLTLVTYEGEVIYGYQLVTLDKGENTVRVPMTSKLSPGCAISVSMMTATATEGAGYEFHSATKLLRVKGSLQVTVTPDKEKYKPGDTVKLKIAAADAQGKPAKAELSLSAVDASLYAVRPDPTPGLADYFFQRPLSTDSALTRASCTFNYTAQARQTAIQVKEAQDLTSRLRRPPVASPAGGGKPGAFAEVPLDHWAYQTLSRLADNGVLEGFPDGSFRGEQAMTRYEIAVATKRALERGQKLDQGETRDMLESLGREFSAELAGIDKREKSTAAFEGGGPSGQAGFGGSAGATGALQVRNDADGSKQAPLSPALPVTGKLSRKESGASGEPPPLREFFAETAFWKADIVTDASGGAAVSFKLPDTITEWRLTARGVTVETLAGDTVATVATHKDFVAELRLPEVFQQGDTMQVTVAAHNNTDKPVKAGVSLFLAVEGGKGEARRKTVELAPHSVSEIAFPFAVPQGQKVTTEVRLMRGDETLDAVSESTSIRPWGVEYVDSAGGAASADAHAELKLPDHKYSSKRMTITLGPSVIGSLIEASESAPVFRGCDLVADVSIRGKELTALIEYLRSVKRGETPEYQRLSSRLESEIARLSATQQEDGGWSWASFEGDADPYVTAEAVTTLVEARKLGFDVAPEKLSQGLKYLQSAFHRAEESDNEKKAALLYAQARGGEADFGSVNRLFRLRNSLDTRAVALVMLALCEMDRASMAAELLPLLKERSVKEDSGIHFAEVKETLRWGGDSVETSAMVLLALVRSDPRSELIPDLSRWLWSQKRGQTWTSPTANTAAIQALAACSQSVPAVSETFAVTVRVNGREIKKVESTDPVASMGIVVPTELLKDEKVRVDLGFAGKGQYTYSCLLTGFSEEAPKGGEDFTVSREFTHPPLTFNGKRLPSGFSTVETDEPWTNPAKEVTTARSVLVGGSWQATETFRPGAYVVVRDPLPVGCRVVEGTIQGSFERFEKQPGALLFFYRAENAPWSSGSYGYELVGTLPGSYRALPAHVWSYYQPDHYAFSEVSPLSVLPRGQETTDKYRVTPDELYHLGKALYEAKRFEEADQRLSEFYDGFKVHEGAAKETPRMLFDIAVKKNDAKRVVRMFEILRERFPEYVVPFSDIVKVAKAYREVGEPERQVQVCRAVAESSFDTESRIAGVLNEQGEFEGSVSFMRDLALAYPDLASTERSLYALSQFLYGKATKPDEAMKKAGLSREKLIERAINQVRQFLVLYASNPLVDEATFSMLNAYVDLEQFDKASTLAAAAQKLYPKSAYLDDYQYLRAYASFLGQRFDEALELLQDLTSKDYPRADGSLAPSDYKTLALYISAQVFHSRGKSGEAVKYYSQVKDKFTDARSSIDYFQHSGLKVPEVTLISAKDPAEVKLTYRNLKQAKVTLFRVDLLKFYQAHRSLANISRMNLAGIKPTFEQDLTLEGGADLQDKELSVKLPLDNLGAYFVVATATAGADNSTAAVASGIVLRTDLKVEVQEEAASGQVRVNVLNTATGQYVPKAEVWVIGSDTPEFRKGQSDLRGVMVAEDIRGRATVIAAKSIDSEAGKRYAFFRGEAVLQPDRSASEQAQRQQAAAKKGLDFKDEATRNLREMNTANQAMRSGEFEQQLKGGVSGGFGGVQVQKAY